MDTDNVQGRNMKKLYLVYGGELADPNGGHYANPDKLEVVGIFGSYDDARNAWKRVSFQSVDNAFVRYKIAPLP